MITVSASLTSKGQITLPKTVRKLLDLQQGDEVVFVCNKDKQVTLHKSEVTDALVYNLLECLLKQDTLVLTGESGTGKTYLATALAQRYYRESSIAVIEPLKDFGSLKKNLVSTNPKALVYTHETFDKAVIEEHGVELVIIDEASFLTDWGIISELQAMGVQLIVIKQRLLPREIVSIGNHVGVTTALEFANNIGSIEKITVQDSEIVRMPVYRG